MERSAAVHRLGSSSEKNRKYILTGAMEAVFPRGCDWVANFYRCESRAHILSSQCATWVLPTQILAAVRSRYFCFYDFTSRIADCSVCSGSTIATRIRNPVHRRRLRTRGVFDRIHPRYDSPSFFFSQKSRWRTRKLKPLESSIGSMERSILRGRQIYEYTVSRRKS